MYVLDTTHQIIYTVLFLPLMIFGLSLPLSGAHIV